jgi:hypothetical protein
MSCLAPVESAALQQCFGRAHPPTASDRPKGAAQMVPGPSRRSDSEVPPLVLLHRNEIGDRRQQQRLAEGGSTRRNYFASSNPNHAIHGTRITEDGPAIASNPEARYPMDLAPSRDSRRMSA